MSDLNIITKYKIHPVIINTNNFIDRFNEHNSYIEMNTSMHIDNNGNVIILVRTINYRKFDNKKFVLYEHKSNSIYSILTGKINNNIFDLDNFTIDTINYNYNIPTFCSYWIGLEDIRFINNNELLVTIPECNFGGNPTIFRASITNNSIHSFSECMPNIIEKNWMPFIDNSGNNKVIYSLSPFIIKSIDKDDKIEINIDNELYSKLINYHGSTNGVKYDNDYKLFLIHVNRERTYHRWLLYDEINNTIKISEEFVFFKYSYIEFPTSLFIYDERVYISLGVNDSKSFIIEILLNNINNKIINNIINNI